jgi:polyadenylate-binding protein 2
MQLVADVDSVRMSFKNTNMISEDMSDIVALKRRIQELEAAKNEGIELSELDLPVSADIDRRSIFLGNVDYESQPEELAQLFGVCGAVNRVTIMCDVNGKPKGFAYLEFESAESVLCSLELDGTEFRGRSLKVCEKRTNVPGFSASRARRDTSFRPYESRRGRRWRDHSAEFSRRPVRYAPYIVRRPSSFSRFRRALPTQDHTDGGCW